MVDPFSRLCFLLPQVAADMTGVDLSRGSYCHAPPQHGARQAHVAPNALGNPAVPSAGFPFSI